MIGILDYGMGNIRSVFNAVDVAGFNAQVVSSATQFAALSHLIIPGVGSYHAATSSLDRLGLREAILKFARLGKPILGICLGMEILSDSGDEGGPSTGLGLVGGKVNRFDIGTDLRLPHVGWNAVTFTGDHPVLKGVRAGMDYYFVHSYFFQCANQADQFGTTEYGATFASVVAHGNAIGLQFHPEKSQSNGLKLIENFCHWEL